MKKRALHLILPIVALLLELLPYGAVCNFANPQGDPWKETFSYFDLTPFGYAHFSPLLTAIATCVILAVLLAFVFAPRPKIRTFAKVALCIATGLSLCPLLLGVRYFSVVGGLITLALAAELTLLHFFGGKS